MTSFWAHCYFQQSLLIFGVELRSGCTVTVEERACHIVGIPGELLQTTQAVSRCLAFLPSPIPFSLGLGGVRKCREGQEGVEISPVFEISLEAVVLGVVFLLLQTFW